MILKSLAVITSFTVLWIITEYLIFKFNGDNEASRKALHIFHGVGLTAAAFIVPLYVVAVVEAAFLLLVLAGKYIYSHHLKYIGPLQYLARLYRVGRLSFGEFFFPVSTILTAFIANSKWEFMGAMLVLGLADAAAALVGKRYGQSTSYKVFGQTKSLVGSVAFWLVTILVLVGFIGFAGVPIEGATYGALLWLPVLLTLTENVGVYGSDNLLIPLVAVVTLNQL